MTRAERDANREVWQERIKAFQASAKSVREWCRENGLGTGGVYYWLKKLGEVDGPATSNWVSVDVNLETTGKPNEGLLVRIGQVTVEVQPGFNHNLLRDVISTLSGLC